MTQESEIRYETQNFWVKETCTSFEVYEIGCTHSTRCAIIGKSLGLNRAIAECDRRQAKYDQEPQETLDWLDALASD